MPVVLLALGASLGCAPDAADGPPGPGGDADGAPSASSPATPPEGPSDRDDPEARDVVPEPTGVRIDAIGLDEELVDLGLDDGGTLEVPDDPDRVGWYAEGGRPGAEGAPTVIVGHVDSTEGPAVFARLRELEVGDEVVVRSEATPTTYVVTEAEDVPQVPFPTEQVFGASSEQALRLITCTGPYDSAAGRYTENRIVTAVPST